MTEILLRPSRPGDGPVCAKLWREIGGLFSELNPHTFHVPPEEGLVEWYEEIIAKFREDENYLHLLAEADGEVVGCVGVAFEAPIENARREIQTDFGRPRIHVNVLLVSAAYRRGGVGTALMQAAEEWGRAKGAEVVLLETELNNPMSMPFYEHRMGFTKEVVTFRKEIQAAA